MNFAIETHLRAHPWALQEQTLSILIQRGTWGHNSGRWQPQAGRYRLALEKMNGEVIDEVGFEVRGGRQD